MRVSRSSGTWSAFLVAAFAVLGLVAVFSTYVAAIPVGQAAGRLAALDRLQAAGGAGGEALRPALGDSADRVLRGPGDLSARVAAERARIVAELPAQTSAVGMRLRIVLVAFTGAAAVFGVAVLSIVGRADTGGTDQGRPPGL
jgi:hypothetical protein